MSEHVTTEQPDGRVCCSCGEVSQRFGTLARAREWAADHRRQAKRQAVSAR